MYKNVFCVNRNGGAQAVVRGVRPPRSDGTGKTSNASDACWLGVPLFSLTKKKTVPKNEAQTTKLAESTEQPDWLKTLLFCFFFLENTNFNRQNQCKNWRPFFLFEDHLFLRWFCPSKMVISKKEKALHSICLHPGRRELNACVEGRIPFLVGLIFDSRF